MRRLPSADSRLGRRLLGIASLVVMVAVIFAAITRPNPFRDTQSIWAAFDSAQGLGRLDRDVRVGGVNVGEVGEIKRVGDDVLLELELEPGIVVHTDANAELRPHTLFEGTDFVDLHAGSPSAPLMEEGSTIPRSRTRVYISIDQAVRVLRKPIREALQDLSHSGAQTLRDDAIRGLRRTLRAAPDLVRELGPTARALQGPTGDELAGAVSGLSATVDALATREASLSALAGNANRTLAALTVDGGQPLDASLEALPGALAAVRDNGPLFRLLLDRFDRAAVALRPALDELTPTLRDLRPIIREATPVVRRATPLVHGLRLILSRAARAAPEFRQLMGVLRAAGVILDTSVLPVLHRESRLGIPTYLQQIAAFTAGAGAQRPYQTLAQNPNGAGHLIRLALYGDSGALAATALPSCALIATLNPEVATQLQATGLCQP
jgi:virulence factor Mce-like protein